MEPILHALQPAVTDRFTFRATPLDHRRIAMQDSITSRMSEASAGTTEPHTGQSAFGSQGESFQEQASQTSQQARDQFRGAGEQIRESAQSTAEEVRRQGAGFVQDRKAQAADQLKSFSSAIRSAADRLHEENDHNLAAYAEATAERVESAARYLSERDFSRITDDVESFARRQPELFLGGMFLTGLGLSRFLKASRQRSGSSSQTSAQTPPGYRLPDQYTGV
jgi:gas vesicle protein